MGIPGSYLVLKIAGEVVAESTDVSLKVVSKAIEKTSQGNGISAGFEPGKIKIAIAGKYLYADNFDTLYDYVGSEMGVGFFSNGVEFLNGYGVLKRLSMKGSNSKEKVTGMYGIRYNYDSTAAEVSHILTEDGFRLTTETGETLIIE